MINSTAFDYVNVLTKAADASYQREAILANNISNVDTPGYKRKDLNFEGVLSQELGRCKHQSLDKKISELDTSKLTANVYTDHSNYSYRMDGNNVDIDTESAEELKIITEKEVTAAKKDLSDALDEEITQKQDETKRSLEKEANSKIMAINEYSDTVLDSINKAHNEIMFLYSMLNDKHDELTRLSGDIDKASSRLRSSFEPLSADSAKRAEKPSVAVQKPAEPKSGTMQQDTKPDMKQMTGIDISGIIKTQPASAAPASKAGATATTGTAAAVSVKASDAAFGTPAGSSANADVINHTHEILKLYKSGKSNVEIAKLLSLGTGEVKLIIDLYKEGK